MSETAFIRFSRTVSRKLVNCMACVRHFHIGSYYETLILTSLATYLSRYMFLYRQDRVSAPQSHSQISSLCIGFFYEIIKSRQIIQFNNRSTYLSKYILYRHTSKKSLKYFTSVIYFTKCTTRYICTYLPFLLIYNPVSIGLRWSIFYRVILHLCEYTIFSVL